MPSFVGYYQSAIQLATSGTTGEPETRPSKQPARNTCMVEALARLDTQHKQTYFNREVIHIRNFLRYELCPKISLTHDMVGPLFTSKVIKSK